MAVVDEDLRDAIKTLVSDLVGFRYDELVTDGRAGRLTAEELQRAIREYGRTVVDLPDEVWDLVDVYTSGPATQSLDVPLWTKEEGRSDLTISLSVERGVRGLRVTIDDLHVL